MAINEIQVGWSVTKESMETPIFSLGIGAFGDILPEGHLNTLMVRNAPVCLKPKHITDLLTNFMFDKSR